ncbi:MAG: hypothetical protein LUE29_12680 [Lachnospiraceae bacterium]|nr:hypothetical protein [Lachnospiraceae bacterium]
MDENRDVFAIEKYEENKRRMTDRVYKYISRIDEYRSSNYNETEVRVDFVNPFFKELGWDVDNEAGLPQHLREVTHEATVYVEEDGIKKSKKPDYSFRVGTETLFYLETKKPSVDITNDNAPAFQLRRYGWSGNLNISVLTNYNDLYIYDCTIRPMENDSVHTAMIAHYTYDEYVDKFDEIYGMLSKEAVLSGNFAKRFENVRGTLRSESFDEYFLDQMREFRLMLGRDVFSHNPNMSVETLNISVQRILNRILFLRICEDHSFEKYELLKEIRTYEDLKRLFRMADKKYDSGLFKLLEEDRVSLSDDVLINIFKELYYPNSSYEFDAIDPFVIGQIYELFLEEQLIVDRNGDVVTVLKPEAVDSQGAVNTPKNVTDIITEQTLQEVLSGKTPEEISKIRVADICCGSGNFLLSAYEYIINYYIEWYLKNDKETAFREGILYQLPASDHYRLAYKIRRQILTDNIWGVDIDPMAVEVAKFSLLLKLLKDTPAGEIDEEHSVKILPELNGNIKNGNSLIDMSYAQFCPDI